MLSPLTREQRAAVESPARHLAIAAGPGTGKTTTLAHRAARLVRAGAAPHRVALITFTRDATATLSRRVSLLLGRASGVDVRSFHSLAARELGAGDAGFLDAADARRLALRAAASIGLAGDDAADRFLAFVTYVKSREVPPEAAYRARFTRLSRDETAVASAFHAFVEAQAGRLDFDDLLAAFRDRLRGDRAFLDRVASRLEHLLVDEYQDVNRIQHDVVRLLASRVPVTVVGDARQAIYGFRGGDVAHLEGFASDTGGARLPLTLTFRAPRALVDAANRVLAGADPIRAATRRRGAAPRALRCATAGEEAELVADEAWRLLARGVDPAEIAVLYRARPLAAAFEDLLRARVGAARRSTGRRGKSEREKWDAVAGVARSTIHAAKGLEWDHVFLLGAREGGLPSGVDAASPHAGELLEEERRLFYVAVTRARASVTVTWPERDRGRTHAPSRFLAPWMGGEGNPVVAQAQAVAGSAPVPCASTRSSRLRSSLSAALPP